MRAMAKTHRLPRLFRRKGKKEAAPEAPKEPRAEVIDAGLTSALRLGGLAGARLGLNGRWILLFP